MAFKVILLAMLNLFILLIPWMLPARFQFKVTAFIVSMASLSHFVGIECRSIKGN